ncbi:hypothetical protein [Acaryochloris sp. IP29b_bin.148]|uniref:hypothetical protein n=1 Tax=Acaryochloris sp. IP29b_bin.148 TaxID=2969218 RepID=UPI00261855B3|nr:hypothetical protein [Acaryochloris sp. IP29b_bin.148]
MLQTKGERLLTDHPGSKLVNQIGYGLILSTAVWISGCAPQDNPPQITFESVATLGKLSVGKPLPAYSGRSESGQKTGNKPSDRNYLIHLFHPDLPAICVNEECGAFGPLANIKGADFYGGSDLKFADQTFGLFPTGGQAFQQSSQPNGVLIISDQDATIRAIYQNVGLSDVETILQDSDAIFMQTD